MAEGMEWKGGGEEDDSVSSCLFLGVGCCPVALRLLIIRSSTLRRRRAIGSGQAGEASLPLGPWRSPAVRLRSCPEGVCAKAPPAGIWLWLLLFVFFLRQNLLMDTVKSWSLPQATKKMCLCHKPLQFYGHLVEDIMAHIISFPPQTGHKNATAL